jgi:hypothetical protein
MRAAFVSSPCEFVRRAAPLLEADDARHNLILSLAYVLRDHPDVYPEFGLWVVEDAGDPRAAALITPPVNLVLADAAERRALVPSPIRSATRVFRYPESPATGPSVRRPGTPPSP